MKSLNRNSCCMVKRDSLHHATAASLDPINAAVRTDDVADVQCGEVEPGEDAVRNVPHALSKHHATHNIDRNQNVAFLSTTAQRGPVVIVRIIAKAGVVLGYPGNFGGHPLRNHFLPGGLVLLFAEPANDDKVVSASHSWLVFLLGQNTGSHQPVTKYNSNIFSQLSQTSSEVYL